MSSDKDTQEIKKSETEKQVKQIRSIFTFEEIQDIVRAFVKAFILGRVDINFPTAQELIAVSERKGKPIEYEEASREELGYKNDFRNVIKICSGAKESTQDELKNAIHDLFERILQGRGSHRINGEFLDYNLETRVTDLERKLDVTNTVVKELIGWLTEEAKGNNDEMFGMRK